ncbi:MAG: hypothetical protein ACE5R6_15415 [Candidatus Heimdallarchaeota archaeon]
MIGTRITRCLASHFETQFEGLFKITIIGSTGSGKTTLLKTIVDFSSKGIEQPRQHFLEEKHDLSYTLVDRALRKKEAFTTVSFNAVGTIIVQTTFNTIEFHPMEDHTNLYTRTDIATLWAILFYDTAGQIRFDFMPEICVRGADGVMVFADGSSTTSIERIRHYLDLVEEEEVRTNKKIPICIFVNKADLREKGLFIGAPYAKMVVGPKYADYIYETIGITGEGVEEPFRELLHALIQEKKMKSLSNRS